MNQERRLPPTPLAGTGGPHPAEPAWRRRVNTPAEAERFWDEAGELPLLGARRVSDGVELVEVSFLARPGRETKVLVHLNSLTDNIRQDFTPWLMSPVADTGLYALDLWLPSDGCYSYRIVTADRIPRNIGHTREGWRWVHEQGQPDPRGAERIVNPLGHLSSVWRGPAAWSPEDTGPRQERQEIVVDCPGGISRPVSILRGSAGAAKPVLVLFDGEQWRGTGIVDRLGAPGIAELDVVLIDSMSLEARMRDLPSAQWRDQVQVILDRVGEFLGRAVGPGQVILGGQSLGGLAAAQLSLGPNRLADRAVCQSGSYWWRDGAKDPARAGRILEDLAGIDAKGSQLVVQVGIDEAEMVDRSREFTAAARAAGAQVWHHEWRGGHDYAWWRDGLVSAVGTLVSG